MLNRKIWLFLLLMLNSSCVPSGSEKSDTEFCAQADPIYIGAKDILTDDTAREILSYDDKGRVLCSWPLAE